MLAHSIDLDHLAIHGLESELQETMEVPASARQPQIEQRRLLELEIDTIFGLEYPQSNKSQTRATLHCLDLHAVVIWSEREHYVAASPAIPPQYMHNLDAQVAAENFVPNSPPQALSRLGDELGLSQTRITGGPTYIVPTDLQQPVSPAIDGLSLLLISSSSQVGALEGQFKLQRPDTWEPNEWKHLIEGRLGPWAMAVRRLGPSSVEAASVDAEAVCICFSARRVHRAAEAGIWTREDFRGKRLAPTVVATWAAAERSHKDILFYSTGSDNIASQSVAHRLGLCPLGWIWKLHV